MIDNKTNDEKGYYDSFESEDKKTYTNESRKGHWIQYDNGMLTKVYNGNYGEHWGKKTR